MRALARPSSLAEYASTLAAAHAESGNFEKAIEIAEQFADENVKLCRDKKAVRDE